MMQLVVRTDTMSEGVALELTSFQGNSEIPDRMVRSFDTSPDRRCQSIAQGETRPAMDRQKDQSA